MTVIKVQNISKKFILGKSNFLSFINENFLKKNVKTFYALKNINFEVNKNDKIALIGSNGSGKSTLLKILSQVMAPTEGRILIKGKVVSILEAGSGFHPDLTGRENIYLRGSILGMSRLAIKEKIDEIILFSEIGDKIDTPVKKYSTGMGIRLGFSITAFLNGNILIYDEILAVADDSFRTKATNHIIKDMNEKEKTLFLVTHDKRNILEVCNRGILMDQGKILNIGSPKNILLEYQNLIK